MENTLAYPKHHHTDPQEDYRSYMQHGMSSTDSIYSSDSYNRSSSSSSSSGSIKVLVHSSNKPKGHKQPLHRSPAKYFPDPTLSTYNTRQPAPALLSVPHLPADVSVPYNERCVDVPSQHTEHRSIYETYWQLPRPNLWCSHKTCTLEKKCSQCQLKEETISNCSSENPPPTFTALDNYRPVRRKRKKCKCNAGFATTVAFSILVLLLILAFILYNEMVIKRNNYIPDPM